MIGYKSHDFNLCVTPYPCSNFDWMNEPRPRASTSSVTWPLEQPLETLEVRDSHGDFSFMDT